MRGVVRRSFVSPSARCQNASVPCISAARPLLGLASAQGDTDAQYKLGSMHRDGEGGPVALCRREAVRRWFELAAAQGHAGAQDVLGRMHHGGKGGR